MDDPNYLYAMMHGEISDNKKQQNQPEKSQFNRDLEKQIDEYVDTLEIDEDPSHNSLRSAKAKKESLKLEIKEAVKLPELHKDLETAVNILFSEGPRYLSPLANDKLTENLTLAAALLAETSLSEIETYGLRELIQISDESLQAINEIAISKFNENNYEDCMALFSLLTILCPEYGEYWFRLGVAAQSCNKFEFAASAYSTSLECDPSLVGARLFTVECYVQLKQMNEAKAEMIAIKTFVKDNQVEQIWLDLIPEVENQLIR